MHSGRQARIDLVVFDCDGVLVDSEIIAARVESDLLAPVGVTLTPAKICERFAGLSAPEMCRRVEAGWGVSLDDRWQAERLEQIAEALERELEPVAGIREVLDSVGVTCCVASSSRPERIAASLARTGLASYFEDRVFSASMVERGKPAPDLFLLAAASMEVDPAACVVVEDSPHGIEAAIAAGMRVIGFAGAGHCGPGWAERLRRAGAGVVVEDAPALGRKLRAVTCGA